MLPYMAAICLNKLIRTIWLLIITITCSSIKAWLGTIDLIAEPSQPLLLVGVNECLCSMKTVNTGHPFHSLPKSTGNLPIRACKTKIM